MPDLDPHTVAALLIGLSLALVWAWTTSPDARRRQRAAIYRSLQ